MDVCIDVLNAEQIPVGGAEIDVFVTNLGVNPATCKPQGNRIKQKIMIDSHHYLLAEVDFSPQRQSLTFMSGITSRCTSFMIINDSVVEESESMIIRINSTGITVDGVSNIVILSIEDDDSK